MLLAQLLAAVLQLHLLLLRLLLLGVVVASAGQHQAAAAGTQQQQQQQQRQRQQRLQCCRGCQALGRHATMKLQWSPLSALLLLLMTLLWIERASTARWHPALGSPLAMVLPRLKHRLQLQMGLQTDTAAAQAQLQLRQEQLVVLMAQQQQQQGSRRCRQMVKGGRWCPVMCRPSRQAVRVIWRRWILSGHLWNQCLKKVGTAGYVALQGSRISMQQCQLLNIQHHACVDLILLLGHLPGCLAGGQSYGGWCAGLAYTWAVQHAPLMTPACRTPAVVKHARPACMLSMRCS
jgi:hypothetical protein